MSAAATASALRQRMAAWKISLPRLPHPIRPKPDAIVCAHDPPGRDQPRHGDSHGALGALPHERAAVRHLLSPHWNDSVPKGNRKPWTRVESGDRVRRRPQTADRRMFTHGSTLRDRMAQLKAQFDAVHEQAMASLAAGDQARRQRRHPRRSRDHARACGAHGRVPGRVCEGVRRDGSDGPSKSAGASALRLPSCRTFRPHLGIPCSRRVGICRH